MKNILEKIVESRKKYQIQELHEAENYLPRERAVPLVPFFKPGDKFLIAELKKASPAKGGLGLSLNYLELTQEYLAAGVNNFSVLTERKYFKGLLADLYFLKNHFPQKAFLRKDFLFSKADLELSYRAGADAVLLIAEILTPRQLTELIKTAQALRLQTLCEVHSLSSLQKVLALPVRPTAIGVNARDLKSLKILPAQPLQLKPYIPENIFTVYESGIQDEHMLTLIGNAHFDAVLIGESVIKNKNRIDLLLAYQRSLKKGWSQKPNFFTKLYALKKPFYVKICGLTSRADVLLAKKAGAHVLGLILARSPRQINFKFILSLQDVPALKVAVVADPSEPELELLRKLIETGVLDGVQFHGQEKREVVEAFDGNAYKVITVSKAQDLAATGYLPVVLYDTPKQNKPARPILFSAPVLKKLNGAWLAGGLTLENIKKIVALAWPGLLDVCSGVEKEPGRKDADKLKKLFKILKSCGYK